MPRGRDAPIERGGGIDPYVATSIQRGKEQAGSRLVAAMGEAGATTRTAMQERGAGERAALQAQTQRSMQAAQTEAQDRRAAEAERARRGDQEFAKTMQEASQMYQAEQGKLNQEYETAVQEKSWDRADKIFEQQEATRRFMFELEIDDADRTRNAILSMTKTAMQNESAKEKAITTLTEAAEQDEQGEEMRGVLVERTVEGFGDDKRMDLPIKGVGVLEYAGTPGAFGGGYIPSKVRFKPGTQADPMGVMQSQLNRAGVSISVEDLSPKRISSLEKDIAEDKIQAQDVKNTLAVIEATLQVLSDRITKPPEFDRDFWKEKRFEVRQMRNSLENLRTSKRRITASKNETVGVRIKEGMGITSLGSKVAQVKAALGTTDYSAVLGDMTKALDPYELKTITDDMSPFDRRLRENYNAIINRNVPNLGGL